MSQKTGGIIDHLSDDEESKDNSIDQETAKSRRDLFRNMFPELSKMAKKNSFNCLTSLNLEEELNNNEEGKKIIHWA